MAPTAKWILVLAFAVAGSGCAEVVFKEEYARLRSIEIGMTEAEVVQKLGSPDEVHDAANAPENYYVAGYSYEKRRIANKVFIYIESEPIAYVYFDHRNRVEYVFVGGS
jgi:outer membrane protein assembly factor BamE (lipoprotein component of BamABCDE complex)